MNAYDAPRMENQMESQTMDALTLSAVTIPPARRRATRSAPAVIAGEPVPSAEEPAAKAPRAKAARTTKATKASMSQMSDSADDSTTTLAAPSDTPDIATHERQQAAETSGEHATPRRATRAVRARAQTASSDAPPSGEVARQARAPRRRATTDASDVQAATTTAPTDSTDSAGANASDASDEAAGSAKTETGSAPTPRRRFDHRGRNAYGQTIVLGTAQPDGSGEPTAPDASRQASPERAESYQAPQAPQTPQTQRPNARQQGQQGQHGQNGHAPRSGNAGGQRISVPYNPGTGTRTNVSRPGGQPNQPAQGQPGRQPNQPHQGRQGGRGNQQNQQNQQVPGYAQGGYAPYPPYGPGYPPAPGAPYAPYPPYGQGNPGEYAPYPPYGSGYPPAQQDGGQGYPPNYGQGYGQQWGQPGQPAPYPYGRRDERDAYGAQRQAPDYQPTRTDRNARGRGYGTNYPEQPGRGYPDQRNGSTRPAPYGDQRDQRNVPSRGAAPQRGRTQREGQAAMPSAGSLYTNVPPTQPVPSPDGRYAYPPAPTQTRQPAAYTRAATIEMSGIVWQNPGHPNAPADVLDARTLLPIARITADEMRRMLLRPGDLIEAQAEERGGRRTIVALNNVNGDAPERLRERPVFEQLTALFPDRRIRLEHGPRPISARIIDLFAPLGFGSRALIVAPPKTGKTTFIREAAESVLHGYPEAVVMAVLVGERPEEVTDLRLRLEPSGGHVYAASFDESTERHAWLVQVAVERAKRVAESGRDAFMVLDSLTRLARAENLSTRGNGRTLSGGIDAQALDTGRRAFGAARNLEEGGSITILATCLVDTGSRQDDVVYEEFKGTGNMEIHLSRELAQRRLFPAVDAVKSGTRREEMLLTPEELRGATALRRRMAGLPTTEATQQLLSVMERTPSNAALLQAIEQSNVSGVR